MGSMGKEDLYDCHSVCEVEHHVLPSAVSIATNNYQGERRYRRAMSLWFLTVGRIASTKC